MGPPFLIVDASAHTGAAPRWDVLAAHPNVVGVIIKATQGTSYAPAWFHEHWPRVRDVARARYGDTWFRGAYHYLEFLQDGAKQADFFLDAIDRAGGWGAGDIHPIVDVELGGPGARNRDASAAQIIACTTAFARRVKDRTGRRVMLYGRGAMRDLGINSKMGCDVVWNPSYTRTMVTNGLSAWKLDDVALWQYAGDGAGDASVHGLPLSIPGFSSNMDLSVYIDGDRKPTLDGLRRRLVSSGLTTVIAAVVLFIAALVASRTLI
jgi:lysozyme